MRVATTFLAVVGLSAGLLSCGGDDRATTASTAPTTAAPVTTVATTAPAVPPTSALLTVADVGPTWQVSNAINDMDLASFAQVPCDGVAVNPAVVARLTASIGVQFEPVDRSYKHLMQLVAVGAPTQLAADLQALHDATATCPSGEPSASTVGVQPFALPAGLGDQRFGQLLRGYEGDSLWYVRGAVVRVGGIAVSIGLVEIVSNAQPVPTISDAAFVELVTTAVAKLTT